MKNWILLLGSLFFYSWGEPFFVMAVVAAIVADYFIARKMAASEGRRRKGLLAVSLVLNVGLLLYFKYANFFVANLQALYSLVGAQPFSWVEVALPVGISFITFQKISYMVDVYRGTVEPQRKLQDLMLYILMFPQLIAGPIVRYKDIAGQLADRRADDTFDRRVVGFSRFMFGLGKKVLIANVLAEYVDAVFAASPGDFSSGTAWIAILAYTFQIYFDFSGYSDMALGLGLMLGFRFPENFNFPYISQSITEFWRRWHITLSSWIKDYLYIPMGGNRVAVPRMYFNLVFAFFISGFWHGAAWTFIVWGLYHGFFLILDRIGMKKVLDKIGKLPAVICTFLVAMVGWIFFRADNLTYAFAYLRRMFAFDGRWDEFYCDRRFLFVFFVAVVGSFWGIFKKGEQFQYKFFAEQPERKWLLVGFGMAVVLYVLCGGSLLAGGLNPFIYFRF
ncbi:MAG: MBOAT family protein [Bacteroidales bacterium]|nr:MBOAT family protein [Bacteroidales bacterium]